MAYEIEHIAEHEKRVWLRQAIESGKYRRTLSPEEKKRVLSRLTDAEALVINVTAQVSAEALEGELAQAEAEAGIEHEAPAATEGEAAEGSEQA